MSELDGSARTLLTAYCMSLANKAHIRALTGFVKGLVMITITDRPKAEGLLMELEKMFSVEMDKVNETDTLIQAALTNKIRDELKDIGGINFDFINSDSGA